MIASGTIETLVEIGGRRHGGHLFASAIMCMPMQHVPAHCQRSIWSGLQDIKLQLVNS